MEFAQKYALFTHQLITNGGYKLVLEGLGTTLLLAILALFIGVIVGTLVAIAITYRNPPLPHKILCAFLKAYVGFFRGTPIVVQLLFIYFVILPAFGLKGVSALLVAVAIFGLNSGAYVSEIVRSGILSVDRGQDEAARALGLSARASMRYIIFPQALKNALPALCNEFITLLKETSVANYITVHDLTYAFKSIGGANYEYMFPYFFLALSYLLLVICASYLVKLYEKRLRASDTY
ncbi:MULTISPECIES: amino acid ABC transporter permease [Helicobacter]|uniref:Amino acid ABC transporter permease n=1 Tax=Helicobacter typhlonius TaxID=76936 RepID=A0A099UEX7_9HELI|nr:MULTISPECIES: amino acid ABC transporter permease [Helicobacter]TLD77937.1 amino acid ABC transporter permease [Helicobacter typhlonius]TLD88870.1 amino acid ABC transporter permease [Helicobacter sp. MIT 03-1616]CUU39852.1 Putative amino acid ABC tansporter permease protein [Helicobacter typhlonius]